MGIRYTYAESESFRTEPVLVEKTITTNGSYDAASDNADGYSVVNVNVEGGGGSSDFSTAEVTVVKAQNFELYFPFCYDYEEFHQTDFIVNDDGTYRAVLYKGGCFGNVIPTGLVEPNIEVTGDIDVDGTDLYIFGDGTITISAGE